ncbi:MAG: hypothetical protein R3C09_18735 [Pirellulaceae bacterium]
MIQESGFIAVNQADGSFTKLNANGHIRIGRGEMKAGRDRLDAVRPGVLWMALSGLVHPPTV